MGTAQAQISSWEMQCPCWTCYLCCQHQGTQLAEVHADQIQLVCKDNTGSFEEKSIRFLKEANIAQDECCRRGPLMNTEKEYFNSGFGSNVNSCFAVHRQAHVLTVMWSKTINWRLCISGQKSQQQGRRGRKGENVLDRKQCFQNNSFTPSFVKQENDVLANSTASAFCPGFNLRIKLLG